MTVFDLFTDCTRCVFELQEQGGSKGVGRVLSLVGAMMPLSYVAVYTWLGALEDVTGDVGVSLLVAMVCGILTSLSFLLIRVS